MDATLLDCSVREYHADPLPRPSLSSSIAKELLSRSPYHAWLKHPRLGNLCEEPTREMERGTLLHALVLGTPFPGVSIAADNYRTKAAQEARDTIRAEGRVPLLAREYDELLATADAILSAARAEGITFGGQSEVAIAWTEDTIAGDVLCRGMIDHLQLSPIEAAILDLKISETADPRLLPRKIVSLGYDVQFAAYTSAIEKLRPELAGRIQWKWLFVEELPAGSPRKIALTVAYPSGELREFGRSRWQRACTNWAQSLASGQWPLYTQSTVAIEAPAWALKEELGL